MEVEGALSRDGKLKSKISWTFTLDLPEIRVWLYGGDFSIDHAPLVNCQDPTRFQQSIKSVQNGWTGESNQTIYVKFYENVRRDDACFESQPVLKSIYRWHIS